MNLFGISMVKNEADIIESFIRHNLRYLTRLFILDHDSIDDTPRILGALKAEGLPIEVQRIETREFDQGRHLTTFAMRAFEAGADFVMPLDADEFIDLPSGHSVAELLATLPGNMLGAIRWTTHVPTADDDPAQIDPVRRLGHRLANEITVTHKCILPKGMYRLPGWFIDSGSHQVLVKTGENSLSVIHMAAVPEVLTLRHYPIRSEDQFIQKIVLGWLGLKKLVPSGSSVGFHWRDAYERVLASGRLPMDYLALRAMYYQCLEIGPPLPLVLDPLRTPHELRYSSAETGKPLATLLKWLERQGYA